MAQDSLSGLTPEEIVERLAMQPHPEGGHYVETYRAPDGPDGRSRLTAIYFLLKAGEASAWHRVDADEVWLWHAGGPHMAPLTLAQLTIKCTMASAFDIAYHPGR